MKRFVPSLANLEAFEAAARHLNFSKAAEDIGMTPSGISRHIKALEEYLGTPLFERIGPRLILTDHAKFYAKDVSTALDAIESASIDVVRGRKTDEALLVGVFPTVASRWLSPRLMEFSKRNEDIFLDIMPITPDMTFETTPVDVAIMRGSCAPPSAISVEMFPETLTVVASPDLISPDEQHSPEDVFNYTLLQNASRADSWMRWLATIRLRHKGPLQGPRFGYTNMLINAAVSGYGIAVVPHFLVQKELVNGQLHMPFGVPVPSGDNYCAVYPERKLRLKSVLVFRDWLMNQTMAMRTQTPA